MRRTSTQPALHVLAAACLLCVAGGQGGLGLQLRRRTLGTSQQQQQQQQEQLQRRRGRRLLTNAAFELQGSIQELEYFFVSVRLGTPAREFDLVVDTGSTMTYVACASCGDACGVHKNERYDPGASSSHVPIPCGSDKCACGEPDCMCDDGMCMFERNYAEQSMTRGFLVEDSLWLTGGTRPGQQQDEHGEAVPLVFGCTTRETGAIFQQAADGLLGLGSSNASLVNQLVARSLLEDSFSLCMGSWDGRGALLLGEVPLPGSIEYAYVPLEPGSVGSNFYRVHVDGLGLNEQPLSVQASTFQAGYGVVLDSGSTYSHLPTPAYEALVQALGKHAQRRGLPRVTGPDPKFADTDICYGGLPLTPNARQLSRAMPSMQLYLSGGLILRVGPLNYLFMHSKQPGAFCLGVFDNGMEGTLLGGITLRNLLVKYDRRNARVGFAHAPCRRLGALFSDECVANPADRRCSREHFHPSDQEGDGAGQ